MPRLGPEFFHKALDNPASFFSQKGLRLLRLLRYGCFLKAIQRTFRRQPGANLDARTQKRKAKNGTRNRHPSGDADPQFDAPRFSPRVRDFWLANRNDFGRQTAVRGCGSQNI